MGRLTSLMYPTHQEIEAAKERREKQIQEACGMKRRVRVSIPCREYYHCNCSEKDFADPEIVGYPPYHDGCTCYVEEKPAEDI